MNVQMDVLKQNRVDRVEMCFHIHCAVSVLHFFFKRLLPQCDNIRIIRALYLIPEYSHTFASVVVT